MQVASPERPPSWSPTQAESVACIELLSDAEHASLTTEELLAMYDDCDLCS